MKIGINPDVARVVDLLSIMDSREKTLFMDLITAIEKTVKENHKKDEKED